MDGGCEMHHSHLFPLCKATLGCCTAVLAVRPFPLLRMVILFALFVLFLTLFMCAFLTFNFSPVGDKTKIILFTSSPFWSHIIII
jgi:hypothetical protein